MDIKSSTIEKFIDIVAKATGVISYPWVSKRNAIADAEVRKIEAKAKAKEILILSKAESKAKEEDLKRAISLLQNNLSLGRPSEVEFSNNGGFNLSFTSEDSSGDMDGIRGIEHRAINRLISTEVSKQVNIESTLAKAYKAIDFQKELPKGRQIEDDWLQKWVLGAENVSNDEMQVIWGKVLAGEFESPGSINLRSLHLLKNISNEEARIFHKLTPLFWDYLSNDGDGSMTPFIFRPIRIPIEKDHGLDPVIISVLRECGIIRDSMRMTIDLKEFRGKSWQLIGGNTVVRISFSHQASGSLVFTNLTKFGRDLLNVASTIDSPLEYLKDLKAALANNIDDFSFVRLPDPIPENWRPELTPLV